ncbi:histidine phosphatase family protein, partial [Arthrospira platensis SPKY1]|nr:histidine phosphatase family protein [Arthrospira platensis SPKY1]
EDCSTQRNLSEAGRAQARLAGEMLRQQGVEGAQVVTSQWCRCRETAEALGYGAAQDLPALNSFFQQREKAAEQTQALRQWLAEERPRDVPVVMVTH